LFSVLALIAELTRAYDVCNRPQPTMRTMSDINLRDHLRTQLAQLKQTGLYKRERLIQSPQGAGIRVGGKDVVNFCANNYLGLANHPEIVQAAHDGLKQWGYGLSSVRFICGTQDLHRQLESSIAKFFGKEDAILYIACFDANGGLFEPLLGEEDAILSDELNHASIIDGVRLCKAKRFRYKHNDMADLKAKLEEAKSCRFKMIFTDSVFSMDGDLAKLPDICALADQHDAIVGIDDCHGTGHLGKGGRGAAEELGVLDRIDVVTSTLGKTAGGAAGGFTVARTEVVDWLKNRSRPYLFSNSVPPSLVNAALKALEVIARSGDLRERLAANTKRMRSGLEGAGFTIKPGPTPILPVMLGDAAVATKMADQLLSHGIYAIGFSYPVVPQGQARIRLQVSAAHTTEQIDRAIAAFMAVGKELGVVK
jgi:glycine C-acetyltransferase